MELAVLIAGVIFVLLVALFTVKTVRIVPQARARNVERHQQDKHHAGDKDSQFHGYSRG